MTIMLALSMVLMIQSMSDQSTTSFVALPHQQITMTVRQQHMTEEIMVKNQVRALMKRVNRKKTNPVRTEMLQ